MHACCPCFNRACRYQSNASVRCRVSNHDITDALRLVVYIALLFGNLLLQLGNFGFFIRIVPLLRILLEFLVLRIQRDVLSGNFDDLRACVLWIIFLLKDAQFMGCISPESEDNAGTENPAFAKRSR